MNKQHFFQFSENSQEKDYKILYKKNTLESSVDWHWTSEEFKTISSIYS